VTVGASTTTLAYDFENRMTTITYPSSAANAFSYNALGTRVGKVDSVGNFTYKRDGANVTDPVLNDGAAQFTPGISERRSGTTKFYHQNDLGTVSRITNTSQSTTDAKQYDAFGVLVASSGSTPTPFGYAGAWGYQEDVDSELKLLGHRYYDPATGRFLTRDPIKDGRNWYGYCGNNPKNWIDPSGLSFWPWADDVWVNMSEWWSGTDVIGPGGEPVRIGGWPALMNMESVAMTVNGTVHINDYDDYEQFINDEERSKHERVHIYQENEYHGGNAVKFVIQVVAQYIIAGSHDGAPYEYEADHRNIRLGRAPIHLPGTFIGP